VSIAQEHEPLLLDGSKGSACDRGLIPHWNSAKEEPDLPIEPCFAADLVRDSLLLF